MNPSPGPGPVPGSGSGTDGFSLGSVNGNMSGDANSRMSGTSQVGFGFGLGNSAIANTHATTTMSLTNMSHTSSQNGNAYASTGVGFGFGSGPVAGPTPTPMMAFGSSAAMPMAMQAVTYSGPTAVTAAPFRPLGLQSDMHRSVAQTAGFAGLNLTHASSSGSSTPYTYTSTFPTDRATMTTGSGSGTADEPRSSTLNSLTLTSYSPGLYMQQQLVNLKAENERQRREVEELRAKLTLALSQSQSQSQSLIHRPTCSVLPTPSPWPYSHSSFHSTSTSLATSDSLTLAAATAFGSNSQYQSQHQSEAPATVPHVMNADTSTSTTTSLPLRNTHIVKPNTNANANINANTNPNPSRQSPCTFRDATSIAMVMSFLPFNDILSASRTCHAWNDAASNPIVWRSDEDGMGRSFAPFERDRPTLVVSFVCSDESHGRDVFGEERLTVSHMTLATFRRVQRSAIFVAQLENFSQKEHENHYTRYIRQHPPSTTANAASHLLEQLQQSRIGRNITRCMVQFTVATMIAAKYNQSSAEHMHALAQRWRVVIHDALDRLLPFTRLNHLVIRRAPIVPLISSHPLLERCHSLLVGLPRDSPPKLAVSPPVQLSFVHGTGDSCTWLKFQHLTRITFIEDLENRWLLDERETEALQLISRLALAIDTTSTATNSECAAGIFDNSQSSSSSNSSRRESLWSDSDSGSGMRRMLLNQLPSTLRSLRVAYNLPVEHIMLPLIAIQRMTTLQELKLSDVSMSELAQVCQSGGLAQLTALNICLPPPRHDQSHANTPTHTPQHCHAPLKGESGSGHMHDLDEDPSLCDLITVLMSLPLIRHAAIRTYGENQAWTLQPLIATLQQYSHRQRRQSVSGCNLGASDSSTRPGTGCCSNLHSVPLQHLRIVEIRLPIPQRLMDEATAGKWKMGNEGHKVSTMAHGDGRCDDAASSSVSTSAASTPSLPSLQQATISLYPWSAPASFINGFAPNLRSLSIDVGILAISDSTPFGHDLYGYQPSRMLAALQWMTDEERGKLELNQLAELSMDVPHPESLQSIERHLLHALTHELPRLQMISIGRGKYNRQWSRQQLESILTLQPLSSTVRPQSSPPTQSFTLSSTDNDAIVNFAAFQGSSPLSLPDSDSDARSAQCQRCHPVSSVSSVSMSIGMSRMPLRFEMLPKPAVIDANWRVDASNAAASATALPDMHIGVGAGAVVGADAGAGGVAAANEINLAAMPYALGGTMPLPLGAANNVGLGLGAGVGTGAWLGLGAGPGVGGGVGAGAGMPLGWGLGGQ